MWNIYKWVVLLFSATLLCYVQVVKTTNHEYLLTNREYNASFYNENKQMLPLVHLFYVNTSEFNNRDTYYFRCYVISNVSVKVKWMFKNCPNGNPTCKRPYEQLLKNTEQDTSKTQYNIFITDVHININETGTLVCNASNSFGNSVEIFTITGNDIEVWPDVSELTLTSGENRTFTCKGNIPVQWYFNQYDQISPVQKESSGKLFSKSRNSYNYFSRLLLTKVSYFDVGYYYCGPLMAADVKFFEPNFKKLYVYVRDETHLIAVPEDLKAWYVHESCNFIIPCRPTSPDVNVALYADYTNGSYTHLKTLEYDQKIGYLTPTTEYPGSCVYRCNANKYGISESQVFSTLINPERPHINVSGGYFDHIITGQNISLHCSVSIKILFSNSFPFELHWEVSTKKLQAEYKKQYFHFDGSITLSIDNVTTQDEGEYVCVQTTSIGRETFRETYSLKTFLPDETYLNLSVLDEDYKEIVLKNVEMVQWVIQVTAYPKAILEWKDPTGKKIDTNSGKLFVKNYGTLSKLVIKEVQVSDSGVYQLYAYNGAHEKNISVTLLVEDTSNDLYIVAPPTVVVGDKTMIKCRASKNKYLNDIKWIHTFNNEESQISINESVSIVNYETEFSYESNLTITDIKHTFDGTIKCVVRKTKPLNKNDFETVSAALPLKVEDSAAPVIYNSSNSSSLSKLGDSVQWRCYAHSVPPPTIVWSKDNRPLRFDENHFRVFMLNNNQTLVITVTDLEDQGNYVCHVSNGMASAIFVSNLTFTDLRGPIIYNSSAPINSHNIDETIQLWCFVDGMPYPNILWYKNDKPLPLLSESYERVRLLNASQILSINYIKQEDQGNYSCHVSNIIGRNKSSFELIVIDPREKYLTPTVVTSYFLMFLICGSVIVACAVRFLKLDVFKFCNENNTVKKWNSDLEVHEQVDLLSYDHRWEFPRNKLKVGKQLGYGAFGVVFKAEATDIVDKNITSTVAVKMMRLNNDPSYRKGLTSELKIMIHVGQHLNIVNLLGACTGSLTQSLMVIVEYCRFGNIYQYLLKKRDSFINQVTPDDKLDYNIQSIPKNKCNENYKIYRSVHSEIYDDSGSSITCDCYIVPFEDENYVHDDGHDRETSEQILCTHDLIYWSFQIARGMEYLASRKVLHGDLATRNILLTENNIVKISDFGLAKTMYNSEYYKKKPEEGLVPVKWMAIESLRDHVFSTQSDVWSFGIVMWEMFSLSVTPYPNIFTFDDLFKRLIEGYRMKLPKYANSKIYSIMLNCWNQEPTDRPSFADLAELLSDFLQSQTKSFYCALNEDYVTMNTEKRSRSIDALRLLTPLSEINASISSKINKNTFLEDDEQTSDDVLESTPMFNK